MTPNILVLTSGYGSTLANLCEHGFAIPMVISQNAKTQWICEQRNIPLLVSKNDDLIFPIARAVKADLIILAGWTRLIQEIPFDYKVRVLNIHPSLLPKYGGKGMYGQKVHEAVWAAKEQESGCTVHLVDEQYDHGTIIEQRKIAMPDLHFCDDPVRSIEGRVKELERDVYPDAIKKYWKNL